MSNKFGALGGFQSARKGKAQKAQQQAAPDDSAKPTGRPPGRVRAKRGDPDYTPVSGFLLTELHEAVRDELHAMNKGKPADDKTDFSDLLNEWAAGWLKSRKVVKS